MLICAKEMIFPYNWRHVTSFILLTTFVSDKTLTWQKWRLRNDLAKPWSVKNQVVGSRFSLRCLTTWDSHKETSIGLLNSRQRPWNLRQFHFWGVIDQGCCDGSAWTISEAHVVRSSVTLKWRWDLKPLQSPKCFILSKKEEWKKNYNRKVCFFSPSWASKGNHKTGEKNNK